MLKPLNENIILQKEKVDNTTASGIILTSEKEEKSNVATVVAVSETLDTVLQKDMKVVYKEYAGTKITIDEEDYIIISQEDILAIME